MDIMDSTFCRLRCPWDTQEQRDTADCIHVPRAQETDLDRKYILQNPEVTEDMKIGKHTRKEYVKRGK